MALYSIEFNDFVKPFVCAHCGEQSLTVWGWIKKGNLAHAVYYAGLMTGHEEVSVRLTVSIGGWGEPSSLTPKRWSFLEVRPTDYSYAVMIREPEESAYFGTQLLGVPMSRTEALASELKDELFAVVDFIVLKDSAVRSYLAGEQVSSVGRKGLEPLATM